MAPTDSSGIARGIHSSSLTGLPGKSTGKYRLHNSLNLSLCQHPHPFRIDLLPEFDTIPDDDTAKPADFKIQVGGSGVKLSSDEIPPGTKEIAQLVSKINTNVLERMMAMMALLGNNNNDNNDSNTKMRTSSKFKAKVRRLMEEQTLDLDTLQVDYPGSLGPAVPVSLAKSPVAQVRM